MWVFPIYLTLPALLGCHPLGCLLPATGRVLLVVNLAAHCRGPAEPAFSLGNLARLDGGVNGRTDGGGEFAASVVAELAIPVVNLSG